MGPGLTGMLRMAGAGLLTVTLAIGASAEQRPPICELPDGSPIWTAEALAGGVNVAIGTVYDDVTAYDTVFVALCEASQLAVIGREDGNLDTFAVADKITEMVASDQVFGLNEVMQHFKNSGHSVGIFESPAELCACLNGNS